MATSLTNSTPLLIKMHPNDNVVIVGNDGGLAAGTVVLDGLILKDKVPQAHKVALIDFKTDQAVTRYGVTIGFALKDISAGSWIHER
jgi:galactarate dehydratase